MLLAPKLSIALDNINFARDILRLMIHCEDNRIDAYLEPDSSSISMNHAESFYDSQDVFGLVDGNEGVLRFSRLGHLGFLSLECIFAWIFGLRR